MTCCLCLLSAYLTSKIIRCEAVTNSSTEQTDGKFALHLDDPGYYAVKYQYTKVNNSNSWKLQKKILHFIVAEGSNIIVFSLYWNWAIQMSSTNILYCSSSRSTTLLRSGFSSRARAGTAPILWGHSSSWDTNRTRWWSCRKWAIHFYSVVDFFENAKKRSN